jgi:hypothetical protein
MHAVFVFRQFVRLVQLTLLDNNTDNACTRFPCDPNSLGCIVDASSSARFCAACRFGFVLQEEECVDVLLQDLAQEQIVASNLGSYLAQVAEAFANRTQGPSGFSNGIVFLSKIANVCVVFILALSVSLYSDHRPSRSVVRS